MMSCLVYYTSSFGLSREGVPLASPVISPTVRIKKQATLLPKCSGEDSRSMPVVSAALPCVQELLDYIKDLQRASSSAKRSAVINSKVIEMRLLR
jgi:hypothetical protein